MIQGVRDLGVKDLGKGQGFRGGSAIRGRIMDSGSGAGIWGRARAPGEGSGCRGIPSVLKI